MSGFVFFEELVGVGEVACRFPCVFCSWPAFPFDKKLMSSAGAVLAMSDDSFDFELVFSVHEFSRWLREVRTVGVVFLIWG